MFESLSDPSGSGRIACSEIYATFDWDAFFDECEPADLTASEPRNLADNKVPSDSDRMT